MEEVLGCYMCSKERHRADSRACPKFREALGREANVDRSSKGWIDGISNVQSPPDK